MDMESFFYKCLSWKEQDELMNLIAGHWKFESIILEKVKNYNNMLLSEWTQQRADSMNIRLYNGLHKNFISNKNPELALIKLSEVKFDHFFNGKDVGQKSWEEFVKLRGY
tara:strand:+ start:24 stop:353 length:330 start_codon:yes stop_codon:yes gene_type:complete